MKKIFNKDFFILVSLTLIFFLVQMCVPYIGIDDFNAQYINTSSNIFLRGIERGINWNMRIGEILFFTIGLFPKVIYNIMISLFFACFLILIKKYSNINYKNKISQYILYFFLIMFFMPAMIENMFKMSDACNHLVGTCFILTVLLPLIKYDNGTNVIDSKIKYNLLIILSFFAGMSSENNSIFILIFLVYIILKNLFKFKKIERWHLFMFISTLAGYSLLIFCGSTMTRIEYFNSLSDIQKSSISSIFWIFYEYNQCYVILFIILFILYLIIAFIKYRGKFKIDRKIKYNLFLLILSTTTLLMFLFAPYFSNKGALFIQFILIINIVDLVNIVCCDINKIILIIVSIILLLLSLISTYGIAKYFYDYKVFDRNRNISILEQSSEMKDTITFPLYKGMYNNNVLFFFQDLTVCEEEIIKLKYDINYEFKVLCE